MNWPFGLLAVVAGLILGICPDFLWETSYLLGQTPASARFPSFSRPRFTPVRFVAQDQFTSPSDLPENVFPQPLGSQPLGPQPQLAKPAAPMPFIEGYESKEPSPAAALAPRKFRAREAFLDEPSEEELLAAEDHGYLPFFMRNQQTRDVESLYAPTPFHNYQSDETSLSYMPGDGEQFGWLSYQSTPYVARGYRSGITTGFNIHLLSGPNSVALPPRLYDFVLGYQKRARLNEMLSVDIASSIGVYSDFEDSARDGIRFPSHGVGIFHYNPKVDWILGVDYLSRDDIKILPVAGFSWHNPENCDWRFDMVFPRPRIQYTLSDCSRVYLGGLMGGGSWDIEFPDDSNDVLTYRDFRVLFGYEQLEENGNLVGVEMGYIFGREIEFRQRVDQVDLDDAFVVRFVRRR